MENFEKSKFFQNFMHFGILSLVFSASFFSISNSIYCTNYNYNCQKPYTMYHQQIIGKLMEKALKSAIFCTIECRFLTYHLVLPGLVLWYIPLPHTAWRFYQIQHVCTRHLPGTFHVHLPRAGPSLIITVRTVRDVKFLSIPV